MWRRTFGCRRKDNIKNDKKAGCDKSCINLAVYLQHDNKRLAAQKARNFWASLCVRFRRSNSWRWIINFSAIIFSQMALINKLYMICKNDTLPSIRWRIHVTRHLLLQLILAGTDKTRRNISSLKITVTAMKFYRHNEDDEKKYGRYSDF